MLQDMLIVVALILLNGLFAMVELAMVSARRGVLQQMAEAGDRGARAALRIAGQPGRFLSTVQFGITMVGILAGAFSAARFAGPLSAVLGGLPFAEEIAFGLVVALITFVSIVVGELVPKQVALNHASAIAAAAARPMTLLSKLALPVVALLDVSAGLGLRLLRQGRIAHHTVGEEEVRRLIAESTHAGIFTTDERNMIDRVMNLADRRVNTIMTPRIDVEWLDADLPLADVLGALRSSRHSRLPLCRGRIEEFFGIVHVKDVLDRHLDGEPIDLAALARPATIVPDTVSALQALEVLKASPAHMVVVVDEHGAFDGLVTDSDLLESIVGALQDAEGLSEPPQVVERPDHTLLVDGAMELEEARVRFNLPQGSDGGYHTLAGLVLDRVGHVPTTGERFEWNGWGFEVIDMDGHRIDKLLITPPGPDDPARHN
jgi:putative hemolysin